MLVVVFVLVAIGAVVSLLSSSTSTSSLPPQRGARELSTTVAAAYPFSLPGYAPPAVLAPDPSQPGVWFLTENLNDIEVGFWNAATQNLRTYDLGSPSAHDVTFGTQAGLSVGDNGTVWVGADQSLGELDTSSGNVTWISVPAPADNANAEAHLPPPARGTHNVTSVAAGNDEVAIAMSAANSVVIYDQQSHQFSELPLAAGLEPVAVSYGPDGVLGVATNDWSSGSGDPSTFAMYAPNQTEPNYIAADSWRVSTSNDDSAFVTALSDIHLITPSQAGAPEASDTIRPPSFADGTRFVMGMPAYELGNGRIIAATNRGFEVIDRSSDQAQEITLTTRACHPSGMAAQSGMGSTCQSRPMSYVVDKAGNIWFVDNLGDSGLGEVTAGSY